MALTGHKSPLVGVGDVVNSVDTSPLNSTPAPQGGSPTGEANPFEVIGQHPDSVRRVADLLEIIEVVRPVIAADGGELHLVSVDVDAGVVSLRLAGACGSCAVSSATLNQGIDRILRDRLDWVETVVGAVEESDVTGFGGWTPTKS